MLLLLSFVQPPNGLIPNLLPRVIAKVPPPRESESRKYYRETKLTVPSHLQVSTLVDEDGTPPSADTAGSLESAKAKRKALLRRNTFNTSTELRRDDELEDGEATRREAFSRKLTKRSKKKLGDDQVVLGTRIGEDHINHVMMYNMLTGIRIGDSRCQAKLQRELGPVDFKAAHKLAFDIMGSELTPSAKYDFKFKDYAPWVFRHLREKAITGKLILTSPGFNVARF